MAPVGKGEDLNHQALEQLPGLAYCINDNPRWRKRWVFSLSTLTHHNGSGVKMSAAVESIMTDRLVAVRKLLRLAAIELQLVVAVCVVLHDNNIPVMPTLADDLCCQVFANSPGLLQLSTVC